MKIVRIVLIAAVSLSLLGTVACQGQSGDLSGSAVGEPGGEDPGSGAGDPGSGVGDPGAGAGDPGSGSGREEPAGDDPSKGSSGASGDLMSVLTSLPEQERTGRELIEEACDGSATCLEELDKVSEYIETECAATPEDCSPVIENFLRPLTSSQIRDGRAPVSNPQVRDVIDVAEKALSDDGTTGGEPGGDEPAGAAAGALVTVIDDFNEKPDETVDWTGIQDALDAADPAGGADVARDLRDAMTSAAATGLTHSDTVAALMAGEVVTKGDAAAALEEVSGLINP